MSDSDIIRDDLKRAYETQRSVTLTRTEFSEKIKADELNVPKYTLGFTCPIDKTIYYAQPFPSAATNDENAFLKNASDALSTTVLEDHFISRCIIYFKYYITSICIV